jgi:Rrf2 family protein
MIRLSKQTDYGFMALAHLALQPTGATCCAREIATAYGIPPALMAKLLQRLARKGLLCAQYGARGGYQMVKPASEITLREVIEAIEGPMALTDCAAPGGGDCAQAETCNVARPLRSLQSKIVEMLGRTTVGELVTGRAGREAEVLR